MLVKNNTNTPHTIITKDGGVEVVEAFGEVEADLSHEYSALLNAVGVMTVSCLRQAPSGVSHVKKKISKK